MGWGWLVEGLAWFSNVSWWVILVGVLSKWVIHHHRQLLCGDVANLTASWIHIILCNYFHTYLADTTRSVAIWLKWFKRPVSPWCWIAAQFPPSCLPTSWPTSTSAAWPRTRASSSRPPSSLTRTWGCPWASAPRGTSAPSNVAWYG